MSITMDEIRAFDSAVDSIEIKDASGQALAIDGSGFLTANINGDVNVTATDLDIRSLAHAQDSVNVGDGTNTINIDGTSGGLDVNVVAGSIEVDDVSDDILVSKVSVTNTSALLVASALVGRRKITIQNVGTNDIFINKTTATTDSVKVPKKSSATFVWGAGVPVAAITAVGTSDVRVVEEAQA